MLFKHSMMAIFAPPESVPAGADNLEVPEGWNAMSIYLGCNAGIFTEVAAVVRGNVGCRSFRDTVNDIPAVWPGIPGATKTLVSLRPYPDDLLAGNLDERILELLAVAAPGAMLTVWHEAGNLYRDLSYITPAKIRACHAHMRDLCRRAGTGVLYGCCVYGTLTAMDKWIPYAPHVMDWYGIDIYDNSNSNNGRSFRSAFGVLDDSKIQAYLNQFLAIARSRAGTLGPQIVVPETNSPKVADRPQWFTCIADWLYHNGGRRMYTFFKDGGTSGGPWLDALHGGQPTIDALNYVVSHYGASLTAAVSEERI